MLGNDHDWNWFWWSCVKLKRLDAGVSISCYERNSPEYYTCTVNSPLVAMIPWWKWWSSSWIIDWVSSNVWVECMWPCLLSFLHTNVSAESSLTGSAHRFLRPQIHTWSELFIVESSEFRLFNIRSGFSFVVRSWYRKFEWHNILCTSTFVVNAPTRKSFKSSTMSSIDVSPHRSSCILIPACISQQSSWLLSPAPFWPAPESLVQSIWNGVTKMISKEIVKLKSTFLSPKAGVAWFRTLTLKVNQMPASTS